MTPTFPALPPALVRAPRFLYLHGFASGPDSAKGRATTAHFAPLGVTVERLSLRQPSLEHLSFAAAMAHVRASIGGADARAVLFGSSLGGLTACRVAEADPRVCALVLLAPAFRMAERWRVRLGEEAWAQWRATGWLATDDHHEKRASRVHWPFAEELLAEGATGDGWPDVRVPTLIVHGVRDDVVGVDLSRAWARGKGHVRLVEVDDGHELVASLPRILAEAEVALDGFFPRRG